MLLAFIAIAMTAAMLAVTVLSCLSDIRSLRIPNRYSLIVLGSFVPAFLAAPVAFDGIWAHIGALVLMFVVTYAMFSCGLIGGGDAKLGTVLGLWVGLRGLVPFLLYMAIMGGVIGLASLWLKKRKPFANPAAGSWIAEAQAGRNAVPYGIAISFGAWVAFLYTGLLHQQLNEVLKIIH